jgi:hypothetical protein
MPTDIPKGSFADLVANSTRGAINDEATAEMNSLTAELMKVQRTRGGEPKGKLTVEFTFELNKTGVMEIDFQTKVKRPGNGKTKAFLFLRRDGTLSEEDERQASFDLGNSARDVSTGGTGKVRDITDRRSIAAGDKE